MDTSGVLPHSEHELSKWFPSWTGEPQLGLQIRITTANEKLIAEYCELCRVVVPLYSEKEGTIVNGMLTDKLREEIKRFKKRKV